MCALKSTLDHIFGTYLAEDRPRLILTGIRPWRFHPYWIHPLHCSSHGASLVYGWFMIGADQLRCLLRGVYGV